MDGRKSFSEDNCLVDAIQTLFLSVKERKINEYLTDIKNVKQENGKRKNI